MTRSFDTNEYLKAALSLLDSGKTDVPVPIKGTSMVPFLREGDTVYLNSLKKPPRRGDIVLFTRMDESFVLHRIVKVLPDGNYLLLGDGQIKREPVLANRVLCVATAAKRKGKLIGKRSPVWLFYSKIWLALEKARPLIANIIK